MTIAKLVPAPSADEKIKADCEDVLREALAEVIRGEVTGIVVLMQHSEDGHWSDKRSGVRDFPGVIGRLSIVMQSWINGYLEENRKCH